MEILGPKTPINPIDTGTNIVTQSDHVHLGLLEVSRAQDGNPDAVVHCVLVYGKQTGETVNIGGVDYPVIQPMETRDVLNVPLSRIQADLAVAVGSGAVTLQRAQGWQSRAVAWDAETQWIVDELLSMRRASGLLPKSVCPDTVTQTTPK